MEMTLKMVARKKLLSFVTLFAIMVNALLPFYAIASLSTVHAAQQNELPFLFDEKILICTGDSFKWVTWEELQNIDTSGEAESHFKCPLCYVLAHGQSALIEPDAVAYFNIPVLSSIRPIIYGSETFIYELTFSGHHSRAPPVFL